VPSADLLRLLVLSAVWGASFIFMRVTAPVLGPVITASSRLILGGLALIVFLLLSRKKLHWREHWKRYLFMGLINSAIPFLLYAIAALYIPASLSVILNSTAPLFGAVFAALFLAEALTLKKILGLAVSFFGVVLVALKGALDLGLASLLASLACLCAASCYGLAGVWMRKYGEGLKALPVAAASQFLAGLCLAIFIPLSPQRAPLTLLVSLNLAALAFFCSALAYALYFQLLKNVGPTRALTVSFLMPVFGILWATLFLGEELTAKTLSGSALILLGTYLVSRKEKPRSAPLISPTTLG
jgi:drug/metabolite transporter (DMT)-like permease